MGENGIRGDRGEIPQKASLSRNPIGSGFPSLFSKTVLSQSHRGHREEAQKGKIKLGNDIEAIAPQF